MSAGTPGGTVRRAAPVVLLVVAACAVVGAGTTGIGLLVPPFGESAGWMWAIRIAGALAVLAAARILLDQRRRLRSASEGREDPTISAMIVAGGIMSVVFLLALLTSTLDDARDRGNGPPGTSRPSRESAASRGERESGSIQGGLGMGRAGADRRVPGEPETRSQLIEGIDLSIPQRAGKALVLLLVLAAVLLGLASLRRRLAQMERPPPVASLVEEPEPELYDPAAEPEEAGHGPRGLITAAYHRLLAALADAGAPRRLQEAPHEHLNRTLRPLGVDPVPMHRLTDLHVRAQFSERPITEQHVVDAESALEDGLHGLRRVGTTNAPVEP